MYKHQHRALHIWDKSATWPSCVYPNRWSGGCLSLCLLTLFNFSPIWIAYFVLSGKGCVQSCSSMMSQGAVVAKRVAPSHGRRGNKKLVERFIKVRLGRQGRGWLWLEYKVKRERREGGSSGQLKNFFFLKLLWVIRRNNEILIPTVW